MPEPIYRIRLRLQGCGCATALRAMCTSPQRRRDCPPGFAGAACRRPDRLSEVAGSGRCNQRVTDRRHYWSVPASGVLAASICPWSV